jgi:hypothetical protein
VNSNGSFKGEILNSTIGTIVVRQEKKDASRRLALLPIIRGTAVELH